MYVVYTRVCLNDFDFLKVAQFADDRPDLFSVLSIDDFSSEFWCPYDMITAIAFRMFLAKIHSIALLCVVSKAVTLRLYAKESLFVITTTASPDLNSHA